MTFINNYSDLDWNMFEDILVIPILSDIRAHRFNNRISCLYIRNNINGEEYCIGCFHNDLTKNGDNWISKIQWPEKTYCYKSAILRQYGIRCYDVDLCYWFKHNEPIQVNLPKEVNIYHNWYNSLDNINDAVPIVLFIPFFNIIRDNFKECVEFIKLDKPFLFYNNIILDNYLKIENYGIPVNSKILEKFHKISANILYSEYFPYTTTGRPSNTFNHINFAALNKNNGEREMIRIQTNDELLIEFDYHSHHVRLAAMLINYKLPDGNLHDYFGKQYFNTPILNTHQYEQSKQITFSMLYGKIPTKYQNIEFFKKIHNYHNTLWKKWSEDGYIASPISGRKIYSENFENITPNKLFNYLLQMIETEVNNIMLSRILRYLLKKQSKLILYTYDSFLFLYNKKDGDGFTNDIKHILEKFNMVVDIKSGYNYNNMNALKKYQYE